MRAEDIVVREVQEPTGVRERLVGRCVNGIAHDLNNFLGTILNYSELIEIEEEVSAGSREKLQEIMSATTQAANLLEAILISARPSKGTLSVVSLEDVLQQALLLHTFSLRRARVNARYEVHASDSPYIVVDRSKLILLLLSLLEAAAEQEVERPFPLTIRILEVDGFLCMDVSPFNQDWPGTISDEGERAALTDFQGSLNIEVERPRAGVVQLRFPRTSEQ